MEENRIGFDENAWRRLRAVSERSDFISPFPDLCNKDGERNLLFILVFLLMSVYLLCIPVPSQGAGGATHHPHSGVPALGLSPARAWLGWEKAPSSPQASGGCEKRLCQSLLAFIPVFWGPRWLCPMRTGEWCRGFPGTGLLGERGRAEKVYF